MLWNLFFMQTGVQNSQRKPLQHTHTHAGRERHLHHRARKRLLNPPACVCVCARVRKCVSIKVWCVHMCTSLPQVIVSSANRAGRDVRRGLRQRLNSSSSNEMSPDLKYWGGWAEHCPFSWRGVTAAPNVSPVRITRKRPARTESASKPPSQRWLWRFYSKRRHRVQFQPGALCWMSFPASWQLVWDTNTRVSCVCLSHPSILHM